MKKIYIISATALMAFSGTFAAFSQDSDKPKFTFKPAGRVLFDGALFLPNKNGFSDGVALPDVRLGGTATYGKWSAKLDIGYGSAKLSMKDVFIQYKPNDFNLIRVGYFVHQFGLNAATSSSMKPSFIAPTSDTFFNATGRNLGVMYVYDKDDFFLGVSAFASSASLSTAPNKQGKISVGGMERFVWRPLHSDGNVVQVGLSTWYQGAEHTATTNEDGQTVTSAGYFDYSAGFPTKVETVSMLNAHVDNAEGTFRLTPELVLAKGRFALESQYYYMNVNRYRGYHHYTAQGAYGLLRCLLVGDKEYGYSHADAGLATPGPKTLECVLGYDYTDAYDAKAKIFGGISNDYSVTFNYYINKYVIARLRWSYTNVHGSDAMFKRHENIIQARLMFKF